MKDIFVVKPSLPPLEEYMEEIRDIWETGVMTHNGPKHELLRKELERFLGIDNVTLFANGHLALEMAIQALGLKEKGEELGGGEVITTPFTFVSTTHAISRNGLKPVFCDIRRSDYCIDSSKIESMITDKTVAIVPVHVYGNVCDVEKIEAIAKKYNLKVIYDGAHAFGETYKGQGIGNFGDATMFSFHATKVFNSVEGGAIAFSNKQYGVPLHELKNFGIHDEETIAAIGGNAKLDEFRSAMGICNLKNIEKYIAARKIVYDRYVERLDGIDGITLFKTQNDVKANYAYFPIYIDKEKTGFSRDELYGALRDQDIFARKYFYPAVNDLECYRSIANETPIAHDVSLNILTLPIYEGLTLEEVDKICDVILSMKN